MVESLLAVGSRSDAELSTTAMSLSNKLENRLVVFSLIDDVMVIAFQSSTVKSLELEDTLLGHANAKAFPTRTQPHCGQV